MQLTPPGEEELKPKNLFLAVFVALLVSTFVDGCGGKGALTNASMPVPASPSPTPPSGGPTPSPTPSATPSPTPNSTTISGVQKLSGWQSCTGSCTNTPTAVYSLTQDVTSPSLSGAAARFELLAGTNPYGGVMWFKYLGSFDSATHFVYDAFFYVDNPSAAQGLEFTVSQSTNGSRYNFSTQCLFAGQNLWRVWDPNTHGWAASSAPCAQPAPNTWNHVIWEFERDSGGNAIFTAVTVNGNRAVVNMSMPHVGDNTSGLDVAFQPDADVNATLYSVWLDNVSLTYW